MVFLFLTWSFIYLVAFGILNSLYSFKQYGILGPIKVSYWNLHYLLNNPTIFLFEGSKVHLWFLIALLNSIFISWLFTKFLSEKALIITAVCLFFLGIATSKTYINTYIGIDLGFNTRNGPFFGTLFFVSGYWLSGKVPRTCWLYGGFIIFLIGCFLHFSEIYFINKLYTISCRTDYVFGTYFMGTGFSIMALSNHPALRIPWLSKHGKFVLGIYLVHFIFVDLLRPFEKIFTGSLWQLTYPFCVFFISIMTVSLMSKLNYTKKIIS